MLNSLYIKNYRLFKELRINSLKRFNLIIGKNNIGKSSLLEAVTTFLNKDDIIIKIIEDMLYSGEWDDSNFISIFDSFASLFYKNRDLDKEINNFYIGEDEHKGISFCLNYKKGNKLKRDAYIEVKKNNKDKAEKISILDIQFQQNILSGSTNTKHDIVKSALPTAYIHSLALKWSKIVLTEKEDHVIEALRIIDKNIERIAFVDTNTTKKAIVKFHNSSQPFSLSSMGDGIFKILRTVLTLVHCENGTLLIDEFENGLHWSVQLELWKIIYHLAYKLNIQIFATTHSRDTLWAFQQAALSQGHEDDTRVIKLKHLPKRQNIKAVEVDIKEVKQIMEQGLEIR
ncbi:AAA ATPase-like domain-containing protein [Desulfonema limicola]|uniref:AAA ATPase-like domain-containing protein n=1 Tax=Desulfonema limicola TaxID=45656 RepID=A0A975BBX6_9BACT|nr:AAA family ATPase [Desulfonema limicola]QTA82804.1 AAA ATPase-like domain-containing protein [Desulfonema limicola]